MASTEFSRASSPSSRVLSELELTPATIAAVVVVSAGIWLTRAVIRLDSPAAISAAACWLSLVVLRRR